MTAGPRVALTFDTEHPDGPPAPEGAINDVIAALAREATPATFFLEGRWARSYPSVARRIVDDGHVVGHHSYAHANLSLLTVTGLRTDLCMGRDAIAGATGADPSPWFRCPYGTHSHCPHLFPALTELGYRDVHWNVAVEDWEPTCTPDVLVRRAVGRVAAAEEDIVLLLHSWPPAVPIALPRLLVGLREIGASFVTLGELADAEPRPAWRWT